MLSCGSSKNFQVLLLENTLAVPKSSIGRCGLQAAAGLLLFQLCSSGRINPMYQDNLALN